MQVSKRTHFKVDINLYFHNNVSFSSTVKIKDVENLVKELEKFLSSGSGTINFSRNFSISAYHHEGVTITQKKTMFSCREEWGNDIKVVREFAQELLDNFTLKKLSRRKKFCESFHET